ncbi:hypothetical protein [Chelatococcus sp. HY11]|nr:hypothetical protein [Chelatococcus sp. HY11]
MKSLLLVVALATALGACALGRHDDWGAITDGTRYIVERSQ